MNIPAPQGRRSTKSDRKALSSRAASSVVLWRPGIVLSSDLRHIEVPPAVQVAEPVHRPESVKARIDAAWSLLGSLADARQTLGARAADAEARALEARSDRERVSATIDRYRIEAALDEVLTVTSSRVSALLKERGLR